MNNLFYGFLRMFVPRNHNKIRRAHKFHFRRPGQSRYICMNTRNCKACWKCLRACPSGVIGKVDFLGHHHALIRKPERCTGCLKCTKTCTFGALSAI
ncbi:MAG: DUF362 domain-containing protein [Mangrovibacterium sp.]